MEKIRKEVSQLLNEQKVIKLPIPVEKIAHTLGVELRYEPFEDDKGQISGMLVRDKDRTVIGINSNEGTARQRFTIAHELGHLVLHKNPIFVDTVAEVFLRNQLSGKAIDQNEIEANAFAAELLMPTEILTEEFKNERKSLSLKHGAVPEEELVEILANKFSVSGQAMTFRLINLGLLSV